ncbi:MAG: hypothetical protein JXA18_00675 [Chitinispirillaceae bacterium]|nr:hypothetical protein [Chitinispirillaceae bacterium]
MTRRISFLTMLFLAATLSAESDDDGNRLNRIESRLKSVINKAGIDFSGTFRSQYLNSSIDPNSGDSAVNWGKKLTESNEYTSVDFDISARPNDALSGRLIFRMHQNWQNFFSDIANPIFTRWISIDGNVKEMFRFNVGNYRQHYTPLTLWSPDIEIAYEPEIFAAKRREATDEVFIGNNDRLLQGVNFNFDAEVVPIFNELHFNLNVARLRLEGANYTNGSAVADNIEAADMDRYVAGGNCDLLALRGLGAGVTCLDIFDLPQTFNGSVDSARRGARSGLIVGGRLNPDTRIFLDTDAFTIGLNGEVAQSINRDSAWYTVSGGDSTLNTKNAKGMAIDAGLKGKIRLGGSGSLDISVGFMRNDEDYFNEMAQSPTFFGQRIMNIENDNNLGGLYTTFDALYDYVFKFAPAARINQWSKVPRRKISYVTAVLTREDIETMKATNSSFFLEADPALQTVFPYGPATPNRTGPKGELDLNLFDGGVDLGVCGALLNEMEPDVAYSSEKTTFMKLGGGISVDIATWAKVLNCLKLSVGYSLESAGNDQVSSLQTPGSFEAVESNNSLINIGVYYNFWKRFSLLAGHQQIINETTIGSVTETILQGHCGAGLEYKVNDGAVLTGRVGRVGAKFSSSDPVQDAADAANDFNIWRTELFLSVDF